VASFVLRIGSVASSRGQGELT